MEDVTPESELTDTDRKNGRGLDRSYCFKLVRLEDMLDTRAGSNRCCFYSKLVRLEEEYVLGRVVGGVGFYSKLVRLEGE